MKLYEILNNVDVQSEYKVVFYDYENNLRVDCASGCFLDHDVRYIYVDNGIIYFEIDMPFDLV